jgi:repressor LexA
MTQHFTAEALKLWDKVPTTARKKLLSNVWCGACRSTTTIVDMHGSVKGGDLVLTGRCKDCGANVARVVEQPKVPEYTHKQGQYLAFIYYYTKIHGRPPAEADMQRYFKTTPPTVHQMVMRLEEKGFISKIPREPRSIRLLLSREQLPELE